MGDWKFQWYKLQTYVVFVVIKRIAIVRNLEGRFEEAVIAYLFIVNLLPVIIVPMMWYEATKVVVVWNHWSDFEVCKYARGFQHEYEKGLILTTAATKRWFIISLLNFCLKFTEIFPSSFVLRNTTRKSEQSSVKTILQLLYFKVSKRPLAINLKTKALVIAILLPLLASLSVVVTHVTMVHFRISQVSLYISHLRLRRVFTTQLTYNRFIFKCNVRNTKVIPYCFLDTLTYMMGAYWYLSCETLSAAANVLADDFQRVSVTPTYCPIF